MHAKSAKKEPGFVLVFVLLHVIFHTIVLFTVPKLATSRMNFVVKGSKAFGREGWMMIGL